MEEPRLCWTQYDVGKLKCHLHLPYKSLVLPSYELLPSALLRPDILGLYPWLCLDDIFLLHLHGGQRTSHLLAPTEKHSASGHRGQELQKSGNLGWLCLHLFGWLLCNLMLLIPVHTGVWSTLITICKSPIAPDRRWQKKGKSLLITGGKTERLSFVPSQRQTYTHGHCFHTVGRLDKSLYFLCASGNVQCLLNFKCHPRSHPGFFVHPLQLLMLF